MPRNKGRVTVVGVGARLRELREGAGLSQSAIAKTLGVDQTTISNLEKDAYQPGAYVLYRYVRLVGGSVDALLADLVDVPTPPKDEKAQLTEILTRVASDVGTLVQKQATIEQRLERLEKVKEPSKGERAEV